MTLHSSKDRILTTHVGSLPRPPDLLDMMKVRLGGGAGCLAVADWSFCRTEASQDIRRR